MKVFEAIAVGVTGLAAGLLVTGLAVGLFVGMCAPEHRKPKFCKAVTKDIGRRLKEAEEKLATKLKERAEKEEPIVV